MIVTVVMVVAVVVTVAVVTVVVLVVVGHHLAISGCLHLRDNEQIPTKVVSNARSAHPCITPPVNSCMSCRSCGERTHRKYDPNDTNLVRDLLVINSTYGPGMHLST